MSDLKECPFCGVPMTIKLGSNPNGKCSTKGCWLYYRAILVMLDDPIQVSTFNTRTPPTAPSKEVVEAIENINAVLRYLCPFTDKTPDKQKRQYSVGFIRGVRMAIETLIKAAQGGNGGG